MNISTQLMTIGILLVLIPILGFLFRNLIVIFEELWKSFGIIGKITIATIACGITLFLIGLGFLWFKM